MKAIVRKQVYKDVAEAFEIHFGMMKDPRVERNKLYPLKEILLVVLTGSISGVESWRDYEEFGNDHLEDLRKYYPFENGIPCKNTFARVMAALNPESFKAEFSGWVKSLNKTIRSVIAIDGKTLCNSGDSQKEQSPIHMISAFATENRLVLAQQKVDKKSNEITAIPKLLEALDLKNQIVTIDAMGAQKTISKQIIEQEGDYILALKGNQKTLCNDVRLFFETEIAKENSLLIEKCYEETSQGHGRMEKRMCMVSSQIEWLKQKDQWANLKTIVMIEETRTRGKVTSTANRFFISSLEADAQNIAQAVRSHWLIENVLHWSLDVVFHEDKSTIRTGHAPENMAIVRHIALNMLNHAKELFPGISIKTLRKKADRKASTLHTILSQSLS